MCCGTYSESPPPPPGRCTGFNCVSMNALTVSIAACTLSGLPEMRTIPVSFTMTIFAPVCSAMDLMFSPPLPMIRPSCPWAEISVVVPADDGSGIASITSCKSVRATSHPDGSPEITTCEFGRSTCMRTPLSSCNRRIVSPPRPIIFPKSAACTGTKISALFVSCRGAEVGALFVVLSMMAYTMRDAVATRSGGPVIVTLRGCPGPTSLWFWILTVAPDSV
mmetsp:Transcript_6586/g.23964  ORF Transcript_6586/g.23964 Transcript_6586/m.23964 type:complete len:221 (-) Transcript_6586:800-1462(-)